MKTVALICAALAVATTVHAGNPDPAPVTPIPEIIEPTRESSGGATLPLVMLLSFLIAVAD